MSTSDAGLHERLARRSKCEKVVSYLIAKLADVLERPGNEQMLLDAAREAGVNPPSQQSRELILAMLREKGRVE
jgi:hypothetical protein